MTWCHGVAIATIVFVLKCMHACRDLTHIHHDFGKLRGIGAS